MDDDELPHFKSEKEELMYWKETALELRDKVDELERELVEFQDNSSQLEKELEKSLENADRTNRDLKAKCNRLTLELDTCREKYEQQCHQSSKQISELQREISEYKRKEEQFLSLIRDLEQKNDDLERAERVMLESVGDIEAKLNSAIERNALLENELDEKEMLKTMVQRLKDEQRDMQQELNRHRRQTVPDNNKVNERVRSPVDLNKLSIETQTPSAPMKSKKNNVLKLEPAPFQQSFSCFSDVSREYVGNAYQSSQKLNYKIYQNSKRKKPINYEKENLDPSAPNFFKNNLNEESKFTGAFNGKYKIPFSFIKLKSAKKYERNSNKIKNTNLKKKSVLV